MNDFFQGGSVLAVVTAAFIGDDDHHHVVSHPSPVVEPFAGDLAHGCEDILVRRLCRLDVSDLGDDLVDIVDWLRSVEVRLVAKAYDSRLQWPALSFFVGRFQPAKLLVDTLETISDRIAASFHGPGLIEEPDDQRLAILE